MGSSPSVVRVSRLAIAGAAAVAMAWPAIAQTRGLLRFADGNVLSGNLLEASASGGLFRSDRFGELRFAAAEATFEAAAPAATARVAPPMVKPAWVPGTWSVGLSGYWQNSNGSTESDATVDFEATWNAPRDDVRLRLSADYKVVSDAVDNNEQSGRVRWLHAVSSPWVSLVALRIQHHTFTLAPYPALDYLMWQGTLGGGWRRTWPGDKHSHSLVGLAHERISLNLLKYDARVSTRATSLLLENTVQLTPKVSFDQALWAYFWRDGDLGIDSQADLSYAITDRLSVGLRHEYRRNAVNLDVGTFNKLSLTTRLEFR